MARFPLPGTPTGFAQALVGTRILRAQIYGALPLGSSSASPCVSFRPHPYQHQIFLTLYSMYSCIVVFVYSRVKGTDGSIPTPFGAQTKGGGSISVHGGQAIANTQTYLHVFINIYKYLLHLYICANLCICMYIPQVLRILFPLIIYYICYIESQKTLKKT